MLFKKFLDLISRFFLPSSLPLGLSRELSRLDPHKIYVENVRSILGVSSKAAEEVCETAVRRGIFRRMVEVLCPDGSVAAVADSENHLPGKVQCIEDEDGHFSEVEVATKSLQKKRFYQLQ
jgi:hypothetical protein